MTCSILLFFSQTLFFQSQTRLAGISNQVNFRVFVGEEILAAKGSMQERTQIKPGLNFGMYRKPGYALGASAGISAIQSTTMDDTGQSR